MSSTFAFERVSRESTRQRAYAAMRDAILSGQLKTGHHLVEIPLAKELGVGRPLVREALQQLIHEGLVEQIPHKGARVVRLTSEQMDELLGVRLLLECAAVGQAVSRLTPATRAELRGIAKQMAAEQDTTRFAQLDLQLHHCIWEISGNRTITKLLDQVTGPLFAMSLLMRSAEQRRRRNNTRPGDHRQLVEAICSGKEKAAVVAMRQHLTENWTAIKERIGRFLGEESE